MLYLCNSLNEERRVMSEEFNTRGARHSKFRVADNFSINNLKERTNHGKTIETSLARDPNLYKEWFSTAHKRNVEWFYRAIVYGFALNNITF